MEKEKRFSTYVLACCTCRWSNGMTETYRSEIIIIIIIIIIIKGRIMFG